MAAKKHGRRAADTRVKTPLTELTEALNFNSGAMGKRAAVVAAAGGLLVTATLPATAEDQADANVTAEEAPQADTVDYVAQAATTVAKASKGEEAIAGTGATTGVKATKAPEPVVEKSETPAAGGNSDGGAASNSSSKSGSKSKSSSDAPSDVKVPNGSKASQVIAIAKQYVGVPYVSGGTSPSGWDCSGFTSYVYKQVGVNLPRTSGAQKGAGQTVSRSEAKPGDIIWSPGHVGIYAGNGMMYDAGNPRVDTSYRSIDWMVSSGAQFIRVL